MPIDFSRLTEAQKTLLNNNIALKCKVIELRKQKAEASREHQVLLNGNPCDAKADPAPSLQAAAHAAASAQAYILKQVSDPYYHSVDGDLLDPNLAAKLQPEIVSLQCDIVQLGIACAKLKEKAQAYLSSTNIADLYRATNAILSATAASAFVPSDAPSLGARKQGK